MNKPNLAKEKTHPLPIGILYASLLLLFVGIIILGITALKGCEKHQAAFILGEILATAGCLGSLAFGLSHDEGEIE